MGQTKSLHENVHVGVIQGKLQNQVGILKRLASLKYKEFLDSVHELNAITTEFTDRRGKRLFFSVKPGSDSTILWKATVRVQCQKVNYRTSMIEASRYLNLKEYVLVYKEITEQVSSLPPAQLGQSSGTIDICASVILNEVEHKSLETDECCICMDRKSQIVLGCEHRFCEECIDCWHCNHTTCPICRAETHSSDENWVLAEKPSVQEFESEVRGYVLGIADRKGEPE